MKVAKELIAAPAVYETVSGVQFVVRSEFNCPHHLAHIHVVDGGDEEVFSLVDGRPIIGKIKHETEVISFLSNTSNRRRLLRRYRNWNKGKQCAYLINPVL